MSFYRKTRQFAPRLATIAAVATCVLCTVTADAQNSLKVIRTVVLDPGHGGGNDGAVGRAGTLEKDETLVVAFTIREQLLADHPGLNVVITRNMDVDLELADRIHLAHNVEADLFVSIHMNSATNLEAEGFEVFFLEPGKATPLGATNGAGWGTGFSHNSSTDDSLTAGPLYTAGPEGLPTLLADLQLARAHTDSAKLATVLLQELKRTCPGHRSRGVRQANFGVLRGARVPAVVVEFGFLSNKVEERWLTEATTRQRFALATSQTVARMDQFLYRRDVLALSGPPGSGASSIAGTR